MKNLRYWLLSFWLVGLWLPGPGAAAVSGPCSDCHTMHYSQNGGVLSEWGSDGPYEGLLTIGCLGCHTGTNAAGEPVPYVFDPDGAVYDSTGTESTTTTLAGGNFYWVTTDDAVGHNLSGLCSADTSLDIPPGFDGGRSAGDGTIPGGGNWPANTQVTCAGTYGCHGRHDTTSQAGAIRGGHHHLGGPAITSPSNSPNDYRMLVGIAGYEDADREFRPTATEHNQYKGLDSPESSDTSTINAMCAQCHGLYHDDITDSSASPWLRHPVNYDLGNTPSGSEYRDYGGTTHTYQVVTPVASSNVAGIISTVTFNNDTIVTCISCHRAHGSPWYKSLRWNYRGSVTGGYCSNCHTNKN